MAKHDLERDPHEPVRELAKGDSGGSMKAKDIDRLVQAQIQANRVNQVSPTGSLTFSGNTATSTLAPAEQAILEQNQIGRRLAGETATGRFADLGTGRADVERASFDRVMSLLNPQFARNEAALRQRLSNQGLPQSSRGFGNEIGRFTDSRNQAYEQAALASVLAGGAEESRITQNIMSLLGLGQPAQPQFINVPQVTVPFQQQQQGASPLAGLLGLGGLALGGALAPPGMQVQGAQLGFTAGSQAPALFGIR